MLRELELEEGAEAGTEAAGPTGRPCMAGWPSSPDCSCVQGSGAGQGGRGGQGQKPGLQMHGAGVLRSDKQSSCLCLAIGSQRLTDQLNKDGWGAVHVHAKDADAVQTYTLIKRGWLQIYLF